MKPESISHYRVLEKIGQGGMGVVYKAEDTSLQRIVALKFLPEERVSDKSARNRFIREARTASSLDHPNICVIHEIDETEDGRVFIAMAWYEGTTIKQLIDDSPIDINKAVDIARQTAEGLSAAHDSQIIHRDIKPANLIETKRGVIKILDFGLAKISDQTMSLTGSRMGTAIYMSPEQAQGDSVDNRTDIWSLGSVLYEMLTGQRAFDAPNESAVFYSIINVDPKPPSKHNPSIPEWLDHIVLRCLEKEPEDRFQSASDVIRALDSKSAGIVSEPTRTTGLRVPSYGMVALVVAMLLVALSIPAVRDVVFRNGNTIPARLGVGVLPYEFASGESVAEPIAEGVYNLVSATLIGMERLSLPLWVAGYRETTFLGVTTPQEAASELFVGTVVRPRVVADGDMIDITLDLEDATTGDLLRSEQIRVSLAEVEVFWSKLTLALSILLDVDLRAGDLDPFVEAATTTSEAFRAYLEGLGLLYRYDIAIDLDKTINSFEDAVLSDSSFALGYSALGTAYWRKYVVSLDFAWAERSVVAVETAVQLAPDLSAVHVLAGYIYYYTGRQDDSEREYRRAIELNNSDRSSYQYLGPLLVSNNEITEAEDVYLSAIEANPDFWQTYNALGMFYDSVSRHSEAATQFRKVLDRTPSNATGYNNLASQYHSMNDLTAAESLYTIATRVNLKVVAARAVAYSNIGEIRYGQDDFSSASLNFLQSLEQDSTDYITWSILGDCYHWLGNSSEATRMWERALLLVSGKMLVDQSSADSLTVVALTQAKLGNPDLSKASVSKLQDLSFLSPEHTYAIGIAQEIIGDRESAISFLLEAVDADYNQEKIGTSRWLDHLREDRNYACHFSGDPCR